MANIQGLLFESNCCQVLSVAEELELSSLKSRVLSIARFHFNWIGATNSSILLCLNLCLIC